MAKCYMPPETNGNLLELDIARLTALRIRGIYRWPDRPPASGSSTGVPLRRATDIITSVKLLPPITLARRAGREVRMLLPKDLPAGSYDAGRDRSRRTRSISHNVLNIDMPGIFETGYHAGTISAVVAGAAKTIRACRTRTIMPAPVNASIHQS